MLGNTSANAYLIQLIYTHTRCGATPLIRGVLRSLLTRFVCILRKLDDVGEYDVILGSMHVLQIVCNSETSMV